MAKLRWFMLFFLAATVATADVTIVAPAEILHDEELRISVTGLAAGAKVDLQSDFVTRGGSIWRSVATFVANEQGVVDPSSEAPLAGSWQGVDPRGFIWSMTKTTEVTPTTAILETDDQSVITVTVLDSGKKLASRRITLLKRKPGVSTTEIRGPIVGTFYQPFGKTRLPAVIVLGGSEGGISRDRAALLASHGYATLALAYFGIDSLSSDLDRVPVETIDRGVSWLESQPTVDRTKIAICGGSKGAELALIAAAWNPHIRAVIAYAPSSVVFQSITDKHVNTSSWSRGDKEVPFAPYVSSETFSRSHRLVDLYDPSLAAAPAESEIPVEKINGPILLLAGKDDALWPSATMAARIVDRAKRMHFAHDVTNLTMPDVGHHVASLPNRPTADSVRLGGTTKGIADAQFRSSKAMLDFLAVAFRK